MKVVLIDDSKLALDNLEYQLGAFNNVEIIGKYTSPFEAMAIIEQNHVDVVFLDIHMPEINGIALAEKLMDKHKGIKIVFVTEFEKYALKAYDLGVLDYIIKPVSKDRLINTLNRVKIRRMVL